MKMREQMEQVKAILEERGIEYETHNPYISFRQGHGECWIFPSQTYDGMLLAQYVKRERVTTAEDALRLCGVIE